MIGERLRRLRKKHGWTAKEVGKRLGIAESTVSGYENGHRSPPLDLLVRFADLYGVSTDYLLGRTDHPAFIGRADTENVRVPEPLWGIMRESLPNEEATFLYEFLNAPHAKRRQVMRYWRFLQLEEEENP